MSMISELVDRLRRESKSMGKYGVDYMATLLMQASDTIVMLSEKARADTSQSCFNCDHYEPRGWCNLFEDTVSPNYKCCSEFAEIKPYEYEIKALHKEYQEPYCEVADTPQMERDAYWKELVEAVVKGEMSDASANQAWYEYINKQDTPQTDLPTEEFVEGMKNLRMEVKQTDCGVDGSEVRMLCKDCEYFKIEYQPIKGFDFGRARCTKYDLITDFRDKRKFKWLSCEDRPKESEVEI